MLGTHVLMVTPVRFVTRLDQCTADPVCEVVACQEASSSRPERFSIDPDLASHAITQVTFVLAETR